MSVTAQEVYERALALIDEIGEDGTIDAENTAGYAGKAPLLIDMLQRELATLERVTVENEISALTDALAISDDTALRIMPYGLAAKFALADKDADAYNEYSAQYELLKRTIKLEPDTITDVYGVLIGISGGLT
jgi:hypothetical protein